MAELDPSSAEVTLEQARANLLAAEAVSKTVKSEVKAIHPGETVIVTGSRGTNGAVSAESIRVGEAGASAGLGAIFGGNSGTRRGSSAGEPALFGK